MSDEFEDIESDLNDDKAGTPGKRLTPEEWESVKTKWELGSATLAQLSEEFGVRADTLQRRLKSAGVEKGIRAGEVATAVKEEILNNAVVRTRQIEETKNDHYDYAVALAKMTMSVIVQARKDKRAIATTNNDLSALSKAAKTLEVLRKERFVILGLDKDDGDPEDQPELMITVMDDEMIESIRDQKRAEFEYDADDIDLSDIIEEGGDQ